MAELDSAASAASGRFGSSDAVASLRSIAGSSLSSCSELSSDGKNLTLTLPSGTVTFDATAKHTVAHDGKTFSYSLGSLYLQIVNPDQSLLQYRQACKKYGVSDGVKATDKAAVIGFFRGGDEADAGRKSGDDMDIDDGDRSAKSSERRRDDEGSRRSSDRDRDRERHRDRDRDRDERHRRDKDRHRDRHHRDKERRHSSADRHHKDRDHHRHRDDKERRQSSADRHHRDRDRGQHHKDRHDRDRHHHKHQHEKHRRSSRDKHRDHDDRHGGDEKRKKSKAPITNEQLMERLDTVVGKRTQPGKKISDAEGGLDAAPPKEGEEGAAAGDGAKEGTENRPDTPGLSPQEDEERDDAALLKQCLSSAGFEVRNLTKEIEADRPMVESITAMEIPVGDSASVLRCGAAGSSGDNKRDFGRVLDLYNEVLKAEEAAKKGGRSGSGGKRGAPPPPGSDPKRARSGQAAGGAGGSLSKPVGKPIIVVPNAMTSPITMVNAKQFFQDSMFVPRDVAMRQGGRKRPPSITVRRRVAPRLGGGEVEYEIVDNPATRLQRSADWDRVVAVVAQGASWQFKGWKYFQPVDIFSRSFGFYIGMEGAPIPNEIKGWAVKIGTFNRDKRGLDSVTSAGFWNGLDEWMSVHKPHYLPSAD
mmetsp:Transcript_60111/g.178222  ORF Transcript_60111/g.178222 Transcript_60111/m.178222 type:complete len:645 (-) Transcript_60111:350-2284(-)|eukprot:CAMPEP_0113575818 /NCGR_PEP_ID=MMETSP0015_2-20120614/27916_1 /TAXON_ID=2838 /ORGANISM="Odontella" /LENGTH=644 /DNA_ID=CAMNT_0000479113 /DNA_START=50 /DNA_END=1984 /DNA_ORIENTATION=+ /assembly_acc=CAM_ASM_000160